MKSLKRKSIGIVLNGVTALLLIVGCGSTPPPIPGCVDKCNYTRRFISDGELKSESQNCNSLSSCIAIANSTDKIKDPETGTEWPVYNIGFEDNKCGSIISRLSFPDNVEGCDIYDRRMCIDPNVPDECKCNRDSDSDCDGVSNINDQCTDPSDPFQLEDHDNWESDDGCADIDNDLDGICDPWIVDRGLEATFFTSEGCVGGEGECCTSDGKDLCPDAKCNDDDGSDRCTDPEHPHYGCPSDFDRISADQFSGAIEVSLGSDGSTDEDIANFLSFGGSVTQFPGYNEVTFSFVTMGDYEFESELEIEWTIMSELDPQPRFSPISGITVVGEPMLFTFTSQESGDRGHPLEYTVTATITNLANFVDGEYSVEPYTLAQTGADQCVQRGIDEGNIVGYDVCSDVVTDVKILDGGSEANTTIQGPNMEYDPEVSPAPSDEKILELPVLWISNIPEMPALSFRTDNPNKKGRYELEVLHRKFFSVSGSKNHSFSMNYNSADEVSEWEVDWSTYSEAGTVVNPPTASAWIGGTAKVTFVYDDNQEISKKFYIAGRNPDDASVITYFANNSNTENQWFSFAIIKHENRFGNNFFNQFNSEVEWWTPGSSSSTTGSEWANPPGSVRWSPDVSSSVSASPRGGFGMGQVTNPVANVIELFNWKENSNRSIQIIETKRTDSENATLTAQELWLSVDPSRTIDDFPLPPDWVYTSSTGDLWEFVGEEVYDLDVIKRYNGETFLTWDENEESWDVVISSEEYVEDVLDVYNE